MTTTLNITGHLEALIGAEFVRVSEDSITVSPANTQQVSEILRFASENNLTVTPTGGSTKQSWGNEIQPNPTKTNIRLELTRLNRVIEHPWQDLTCTVQAGCTWQQLQQALAKHGQFVALDPLWPERATVGGILATNDSGTLRHRYGSLRDLVIGMTLVLADGTIARSGGKVVKNVAGYDLCKLVTGSFGTLAIITEATFRLHPLPQQVQTFTVFAPQAAQLAPLMQSIRASHLLTQALQLRGDTNGFHLDIQLNAHPEAKQNEILQKMTEAEGLKLNESLATIEQQSSAQSHSLAEPFEQTSQVAPAEPLASASQIAPKRDDGGSSGLQVAETKPESKRGFSLGPLANVWQTRERLFAKDEAFTLKLTMLPIAVAEISDYLARCEAISVAQSLGITYAELPAPNHNSVMHIELLEDLLEKAGGALTILKEPRSLQHDLKEIMSKPTTLSLMQAVKHQFDPNHTLNPGRFLGGI
jgi:FAD/FMN-containing dehydrogenase